MTYAETKEHRELKELFCKGIKKWIGASIEEYPSSGHELDIFGVTSEGISIYVEVIWTDTKTHFLSDINMLQQSDADIKLVVGSPGVIKKHNREFSKVVVSQRRAGKIIHEEIVDGLKILQDSKYFEDDIKKLILELVKQAKIVVKQKSPSINDLTKKMLGLVKVKTTIQIPRDNLMESFPAFAFEGNGVVVGAPGVGKTFVLQNFSSQLVEQNAPCLYLPIDKIGVETEAALKAELEIKGDFIAYLKSQKVADDKTIGILVIDAFDAARSETAQSFFLSLIRRVANELHGLWNIIVSVRTYDAKKSEDLQDLFLGSAESVPPSEFQMEEIHCRHFAIPKLTDDEVRATVETIPHLLDIYERGSADFKEVLRIPFNLWLIEKILSRNSNIPELSSISSEIQLLELLWKQRVTDGLLGESRRVLLTKVTRAMVAQRSLSVCKDEVYVFGANDAWNSLLNSEILVNTSTTAQRVAFSHNILFDYAVSVLLIEDAPDKLVEFVTEDPSRPFFLRPSLNYYFTRLWHNNPVLFWKVFWYILPSSDIHLRLFTRLLPTSVIANEAQKFDQLTPLLDALAETKPIANEAVLRLLQALRALQIERDELWVQFLDKTAEHLHRDFAGDLAVVTSDILDRADKDNTVLQACGRVSRHLLEWTWKKREEDRNAWVDGLGANWAVPLVAKTFDTNQNESRLLLEKVLRLIKEENFPIKFLYRLIVELDKIWPHDPDFVVLTYLAVFSHYETSEEKTNFGTPILPMSSTRRQDYEMCQYELIKHFPNFLRAAPLPATQAVIECLNNFIIDQHIVEYLKEGVKLEDLPEEFQFRGKAAHYVPDGSYIWDEAEYTNQPIQMANELYKFIGELASSQTSLAELDSLLDVFRDNVWAAFFWRRLLETAAQAPKVFASRLFELCIARPMQIESETLRELGVFLEAAASEFTDEQLRQIEETIMTLPEDETDAEHREYLEHRRDRLLARIPAELLKTDDAKKVRKAMEKVNKVPTNEPLVTFSSWSEPYSEEKWLKKKGVDLLRPENQELQKFFAPLEKFTSAWQNKIPTADAVKSILPVATESYAALNQNIGADSTVLNSAWTKLASCVETMSREVAEPESDVFQFCREVLLLCAKHEAPKPNPKYDLKYNSPSWSSAPRNEAAQGLPWLDARKPDAEIVKAIDALVHDKVPSVRFLVTRGLFRLSVKAPEDFWRLAEDVAEHEPNQVVQQSLCHTLSRVVAREEAKTTKVLDKLVTRVLSPDEDSDLLDSLVSLVMWLSLARENAWAMKTADAFLAEPIRLAKPLKRATFDALAYITPKNLDSPKDCEVTERAIGWLTKAIGAAAKGIKKLQTIPNEQWNVETQSKLRDVYGVIDEIIMRLYFAADVRDNPRDKKEEPVSDEQRKDFYFKVKPLLERVLAFALDKENGVMFAPTAHHFMELLNGVLKYDPKGALHMAAGVAKSSKPAGYNLDSLAIREVVKLVEAILADYRDEVRDGESLRDLLNLLDIFAETGWPDALRLVWRLDEVFR